MHYGKRSMTGWALLAFGVVGCSSARDVEVSGKVSAPSSLTVGDKVVVDFIDVVGEGSEEERTVAHVSQLSKLGEFKETVPLEGDRVLIRAIDDRDGNGECSAGEAWGEVQAEISENKVEAASLTLSTAACPAVVE